jgi:hypothetical protein
MRIAWFIPLVVFGLAACTINTAPPSATVGAPATVVTPAPTSTVVTPAVPGTVITTP